MGLKEVAEEFKNDDNIAIVSFTVDPETDDPARLKWYIHQLNINSPHWTFLTGDKPEIYKLARRSFFLTASDGDGGPNDFIHSDKLVLIDKENLNRIWVMRRVLNPLSPVEQMEVVLERLSKTKTNAEFLASMQT